MSFDEYGFFGSVGTPYKRRRVRPLTDHHNIRPILNFEYLSEDDMTESERQKRIKSRNLILEAGADPGLSAIFQRLGGSTVFVS
jgi:hypothetical protein